MSSPIHNDAISAWAYLCQSGGIELEGRDEGLDTRVREYLDPGAVSLEDALSAASLEEFTEAFFHSLHDYVEMFRDILDFFENGKATKGESQWTLRVGEVNLELEHFREWLAIWDTIAKANISVPAIDKDTVWQLLKTLDKSNPVQNDIKRLSESEPSNVSEDVLAWVKAYNNDIYLSLPESLLPPQCSKALQDCASIARAALHLLRKLKLTPSSLKKLYNNGITQDQSSGLAFHSILQNETDLWLRSFIVAMSSAASLPDTELRKIGEILDSITSRFPRRPLEVDVAINDLESVLSLPIWGKRYDLFSVWIATEIIRSLNGHDVEIHHDNGRITFPFKETLVATIHSSPGPFRLLSERRIPLKNPRGEGRKAGVQPDHGLWTVRNGEEACRMAIEVKHYKQSAKSKFINVFEDYARAIADGDVYLVNHGPINESVYDLSQDVRDRCFAVGRLTVSNRKARQVLATAVRECVGEPIAKWPDVTATAASCKAFLFDVSASMSSTMRSEAMNSFVRCLAASELPSKLVAADTNIVGEWEPNDFGFSQLLCVNGGSTELKGPVSQLLQSYDEVLLITDNDGLSNLESVVVSTHESDSKSPPGTNVRVCRRA